jgi:hypothetical protein
MATIQYREASGLDLSNIYRLLKSEHDLLDMPFPVLNVDKTIRYVSNLVRSPNGRVWVADLSGRLVGTLICSIVQPLWSDLWFLSNDFFTVDQHFRKHGVAQKLIELAKMLSEEKRLPIWFEVTTGGRAELKDRFIAFQGLTYMGGRHLYWPSSLPHSGVAIVEAPTK